MSETSINKNTLIAQLTKSPHGKLEEYIPITKPVSTLEPEFLAHLIAWNERKGQVRDSKVALPIIALMGLYPIPGGLNNSSDFSENALAHLALQSPRDYLRGLRFSLQYRVHWKMLKRLTTRYLRSKEQNWKHYERMILFHRRSVKELYALSHTKPAPIVDQILFKGQYPRGTVFSTVAALKDMSPMEAAGAIMQYKLPFLSVQSILGPKLKEPELLMALIGRMSPTELVTNTRMLEKLGVRSIPAARAAYEEALKRAATSTKNTLKTTKQAENLEEDNPIREKLLAVQEKQLDRLGSIEGDWLILADKSGSMEAAIYAAAQIAATLGRMVKGRVWLVFFDTVPRAMDVTGRTLEQIRDDTKYIIAQGGTSIGCGLQWILEKGYRADGICLVSDGCENHYPQFAAVYEVAAKRWDNKPPVYWYQLEGKDDPIHATVFMENCKRVGADPIIFDMRGGQIDYYGLPNLIKTMRVKRYDLIDEIMESRLLTVPMVLPMGAGE